jgi:hypothetical protein
MLLVASADEQTTEGRMQLATIRKDQGNALFAAGEYRRALGWYGRSMALIGASADDERVVNASTQVTSFSSIVGLFCSYCSSFFSYSRLMMSADGQCHYPHLKHFFFSHLLRHGRSADGQCLCPHLKHFLLYFFPDLLRHGRSADGQGA